MTSPLDVIVVGAGPYGLSLGAHLAANGLSSRVFGPPMEVWREHMPKGMLLKSDGFASNLSDPASKHTLKQFCLDRGIPYDDTHIPVAIETFIDYGMDFQKKLVPQLDSRHVARIDRTPEGFVVELEDGEIVTAHNVIVAVGISHFSYVPPVLAEFSRTLVTHSSDHRDLADFHGRSVTIVGGGASAIDLGVLMYENGARTSVVARAESIEFHTPPRPGSRTLWQRVRNPSSGLGPGWKSSFFTRMPGLFRYFPASQRIHIARRHLGPAPGWPMRRRAEGKLPILLGRTIVRARSSNGTLRLSIALRDGCFEEIETEHVVAATGYRPDLRRLQFLGGTIQGTLRHLENAPVLSPDFQSSIPGLYFVGAAAVYDFGPMMRFAYGSDYTAHRLASHLRRKKRR